MKIQKLTIDETEINQAVQTFIKTKGIDMPVASVSKEYSWKNEWEVEFVQPKVAVRTPAVPIPEPPSSAPAPQPEQATEAATKEIPL